MRARSVLVGLLTLSLLGCASPQEKAYRNAVNEYKHASAAAVNFTQAQVKQLVATTKTFQASIEAYRPFFILGEVTNPGQYPYVANMTAETAIAIAGGFAPRASKSKVELTRNAAGQQMHGDVPLGFALRPGDTVVVKERWF